MKNSCKTHFLAQYKSVFTRLVYVLSAVVVLSGCCVTPSGKWTTQPPSKTTVSFSPDYGAASSLFDNVKVEARDPQKLIIVAEGSLCGLKKRKGAGRLIVDARGFAMTLGSLKTHAELVFDGKTIFGGAVTIESNQWTVHAEIDAAGLGSGSRHSITFNMSATSTAGDEAGDTLIQLDTIDVDFPKSE